MSKNVIARPKATATLLQDSPTVRLNPNIARLLAGGFADDRRLTFARSFTLAIVRAWSRIRNHGPRLRAIPESIEFLPLSAPATAAAEQFAAAMAEVDVPTGCYCIGAAYTAALPEAHRSEGGIYYTPAPLAERIVAMAENAGVDWRSSRVLDPACGGGAFLLPVAARMIAAMPGANPAFILQQLGTRLRGYDSDPFGAWLAQAMFEMSLHELTVATGRPAPIVVETRDSLELRTEDADAYDLVIGNPPYGRVTLAPERRRVFARSTYGHANYYGLFTDAALRWARQGGVIAFVTPTSMLSGLYYKLLRVLLASEAPPVEVNVVNQRDGVFVDVLQETMLATYRRNGFPRGGSVGFISIGPQGETSYERAGTIVLPSRRGAPWLLPRRAAEAALTRRLRSMPHRLADYGYGVSTGPLVWNRHKEQFRTKLSPKAGLLPVIWAESVTSAGAFAWRSEKRNHAPWFAVRRPKDNWLVVDRPCILLQRTTAKEQARRLIAAELPESFIRKHNGVVVENHLNMVRAVAPRPRVSAKVIAALLNSALVDAAFRCINGSVAVSAFELEELPLPSPTVLAIVERLLASGASVRKIEAVIAAAYVRGDAAAAP